MDKLLKTQIEKMIQTEEYPCISIYLQTYEFGREVNAPTIRLKNILRTCERKLKYSGISDHEISEILKPIVRTNVSL